MKLPAQANPVARRQRIFYDREANRVGIFPSALSLSFFWTCRYICPGRPFSDYCFWDCEPRIAWQTDDGQSGVIP